MARRKAGGKAQAKAATLGGGAADVGTKERAGLLKVLAGQPHKKPQDTLQVSWIDPDEALPTGENHKEMLL